MTDRRTITIVTLALAVLCLGGLGGVIFLTTVNQDIPDLISNVVTTSLGALAALLASTRVDPGQLPAERPSLADTPKVAAEPRRARRAAAKPAAAK